MTTGITSQTQIQPRIQTGETTGTGGATSTQKTGSGAQGQSGAVPAASAEPKMAASTQNSISQKQAETQAMKEVEGYLEELEAALSTEGDTALNRIENLLSGIRSDSLLGELLLKFAAISRDQALEARLNARAEAQGELKSAAKDVAQAAAKAMSSAMTQAIVGIVAASVSIFASMASSAELGKMKNAIQNLDSLKGTARTADDAAADFAKSARQMETKNPDNLEGIAAFKNAEAAEVKRAADAREGIADIEHNLKKNHVSSEMKHEMGQAAGQAGQAAGQLSTANMDYQAALDEQDKMEAQAAASLDESNMDLLAGVQTELLEMIRATLEFIKEQNRAEADLMASMTRVAG